MGAMLLASALNSGSHPPEMIKMVVNTGGTHDSTLRFFTPLFSLYSLPAMLNEPCRGCLSFCKREKFEKKFTHKKIHTLSNIGCKSCTISSIDSKDVSKMPFGNTRANLSSFHVRKVNVWTQIWQFLKIARDACRQQPG